MHFDWAVFAQVLAAAGAGSLLPRIYDTITTRITGKAEKDRTLLQQTMEHHEHCKRKLMRYMDAYYDERGRRRAYQRKLIAHGFLDVDDDGGEELDGLDSDDHERSP